MNSWAVSACYPRSTFYPLSDGPSIQNHRITKTYFHYLLRAVTLQSSWLMPLLQLHDVRPCLANLRVLRYSLGGDRPSNYHQTRSPIQIMGPGLEHQTLKGGISRLAPCRLASTLQSLPPILHIKAQCSVSSYSKGSRVFPSCRGYTASSQRVQFH